ncbi:MAG TPA: 50S ribosomal protein L4 [Fimbriiglobus sp.]|jgi:large subunit ribosomal protein L4
MATAPTLVTEVTDTISVPVVDAQGKSVGTETIDPKDFGGKISRQLLHDVVLMYRANQRAGTHHTLRRGEVAGSTKKLFRQKGTGNARAGTKRTNKRRGGGTAKGPKPRDYAYAIPKQALRAATRMALLSKFQDGEAVIVESFGLTDKPKTKQVVGTLKAIGAGKKTVTKNDATIEKTLTLLDMTVLIGTDKFDLVVYKSARNIDGVEVLPAAEFNAWAVLKQRRLVLTRAALDVLKNKKAK